MERKQRQRKEPLLPVLLIKGIEVISLIIYCVCCVGVCYVVQDHGEEQVKKDQLCLELNLSV